MKKHGGLCKFQSAKVDRQYIWCLFVWEGRPVKMSEFHFKVKLTNI